MSDGIIAGTSEETMPDCIQVQLNPIQSQLLTEIAHTENESISKLVENLLEEAINRKRQTLMLHRFKTLEMIKQHRSKILSDRGGKPLNIDPSDILQEIRDERDEHLFNVFGKHSY